MKIAGNNTLQNYGGMNKKSNITAGKSHSDQVVIGNSEDTSWMMSNIGDLKSTDGSCSAAMDQMLKTGFTIGGAVVGGTGGAIAGGFLGGGWGVLGLGLAGAAVGGFIGNKIIK